MHSSMIIHPDEVSKKWVDRLCNIGVKALGIHPRGGADSVKSLSELLSLSRDEGYRAVIDYAKSRGLEIEYELHAAGYLLPRNLFLTNPEYFRMNEKGERTSDFNFCVSNPDALAIFSKRAGELSLSLYGSSDRYFFWLDDGHNLKCHCPRCRSLSASDQQLICVNAMLDEIRRYKPNARLAYLAYMDSILVPTTVLPRDGVFLEYAPFEKYTAKGEDAPKLIARERELILPLIKFFSKNGAKVLEYWYDNSLYSNWTKPPKRFTLKESEMENDICDYVNLGFCEISTFACYLGRDYEDLYGEVDASKFGEVLAKASKNN